MPLQRTNKGYRDISLSFGINPINSDLIDLKNENSISRAVQNLILTNRNERFFNPNLGSNINRQLFEIVSPATAKIIEDYIRDTLINYEPRINLLNVSLIAMDDQNAYDVTIEYEIVGVDTDSQQLTFVLQE
jgi:phage baseplate assembly protein W